jgi:hypothetical protein
MPNAILTPTAVTREILRVLHQKLTFVGSINTQYDSSFAKSGAKIGTALKIRLPNEYVVRTGTTLTVQDTNELSTTLTVATQKGVDLTFTSQDLTMSLDDFSKRIIQPAASVLAAAIEADALSMVKDVYNTVFNLGSAITFAKVMGARKVLVDNLCPQDDNLTALLNTQDTVDLIDSLKGLFQDSNAIKQQYRDGVMGRTAGFEFTENTLMNTWTSGTATSGTTSITTSAIVSGGTAGLSSIPVSGSGGTLVVGDVIIISGMNRCHPESKADTGVAQQFVVTAAFNGSASTISVSPTIWTSTGRQNVFAQAAAGQNIRKPDVGVSKVMTPSLFYHKDAFAFATADLQMPDGIDWAARQVMDGISIRIVRAYSISDDTFPCRLDVLYGYKTIRPQLACKIISN